MTSGPNSYFLVQIISNEIIIRSKNPEAEIIGSYLKYGSVSNHSYYSGN